MYPESSQDFPKDLRVVQGAIKMDSVSLRWNFLLAETLWYLAYKRQQRSCLTQCSSSHTLCEYTIASRGEVSSGQGNQGIPI